MEISRNNSDMLTFARCSYTFGHVFRFLALMNKVSSISDTNMKLAIRICKQPRRQMKTEIEITKEKSNQQKNIWI